MSSRAAVLLLALAVVPAACASGPAPPAAGADGALAPAVPAAAQIPERLDASAEAWNRGDLDGFLAPYLDAAETTFVGAAGLVRGLDRVRAGYGASYWRNGGPEETLRFDDLEVSPLGSGHALVTGRYLLDDPDTGRTISDGFFTLVWRWTDDGWRIIHDHSSAAES